jgi:hypothetical protein
VDGGLTRVLSSDDVMGGVVCAEAVTEANSRTSDKPAVKREINRTGAELCFFNAILRDEEAPSSHTH